MSYHSARIAATVAIAFFSNITLADAFHNGFYIGLNTGASFATVQNNDFPEYGTGFQVLNRAFIPSPAHFRDESSARGYNGGALIGWNLYCDHQYVYSIEASGNLYSNRAHQSFWTIGLTTNSYFYTRANFEESWDIRYSADLVFKPGYLVSNTTELYGILGASVAGLDTKLENLSPDTAYLNHLTFEDSKTLVGFVLGAGIQKQLCNNLSFFASYQYTYYGKQDLSTGLAGYIIPPVENPPIDLQTYVERSICLDTNVIKVGFTYTF